MSRIGKLPVSVPAGVEVKIGADVIDVRANVGLQKNMMVRSEFQWCVEHG